MTQRPPAENGPIYNVTLIDVLPIGEGGWQQQMPSRKDLILCGHSHKRVAAGYEVLLAHYHRVCAERDRLHQVMQAVIESGTAVASNEYVDIRISRELVATLMKDRKS